MILYVLPDYVADRRARSFIKMMIYFPGRLICCGQIWLIEN